MRPGPKIAVALRVAPWAVAVVVLALWAGDQRHLDRAQRLQSSDAAAAVREAGRAGGVGTRRAALVVQGHALAALGDLAGAERALLLARDAAPDDPMIVRDLRDVARLRGERRTARRYTAQLRRSDPRYAAGTGR